MALTNLKLDSKVGRVGNQNVGVLSGTVDSSAGLLDATDYNALVELLETYFVSEPRVTVGGVAITGTTWAWHAMGRWT